ncbi:MAG: PQQ-binding-like beta-propeller repeat protein [Polyangiaceae bacterium]|nr:PQQ-binding-like beta-propeller repeat protein [Polyangiaceae bacterium]
MARCRAAWLGLCLPLCGCAEKAPPKSTPIEDLPALADFRPESGFKSVGEDITDYVRAQNAEGREPPMPKRKGGVARTGLRPRITKRSNGFVANIPRASRMASPAFYNGRIYAAGFGSYELYALGAQTGKPEWGIHLSDDGPTDPACKDGVCVFNTFSCTLFGVDADTGKHLWSWYLGAPQLATPVVAGKIVYSSYPSYSSETPFVIAAFDLHTGKPLWQRWIDDEVVSTPVAHKGSVYLGTRLGTLYQFGAENGEVISAKKSMITSPPVVTARGILFNHEATPAPNDYIVSSAPIFPELEVTRLRQQRIEPKPRPLVSEDRFIEVDNGVVRATNLSSGDPLWHVRMDDDKPANINAPLLRAGSSVLLATAQGNILRIDPDSGQVISVFQLEGGGLSSQPIAVDGWIYAGTHAGTIVAYDTGDGSLTGWEMLGGGPDRRGTVDPEGT